MLITLAIVLFIVWAILLICAVTFNGLVHVILATAVVLFLLQSIRGGKDSGDGV
ncbi:MAG: DUF5670 family protein [Candidatus Falkowbacteria bacterium]